MLVHKPAKLLVLKNLFSATVEQAAINLINTSYDKKMKRSFTLYLLVLVLSFGACSKDAVDTHQVSIRVVNATNEDFNAFSLNATQFGPIAEGDTTAYLVCRQVYPVAFANDLTINGAHKYIADIVPTPFLKNGKYLMKVVIDSTTQRYDASFIQE